MQNDLDRLNKWALYSQKLRQFLCSSLKQGDIFLPKVSEFKFLGVTFDTQLTFKSYINNIIRKSKSTLNLLRAISGTSWGAQTDAMLMVYKACILSKIDYGSEAYGCASPHLLQQLRIIAKVPDYVSGKKCISSLRLKPHVTFNP